MFKNGKISTWSFILICNIKQLYIQINLYDEIAPINVREVGVWQRIKVDMIWNGNYYCKSEQKWVFKDTGLSKMYRWGVFTCCQLHSCTSVSLHFFCNKKLFHFHYKLNLLFFWIMYRRGVTKLCYGVYLNRKFACHN